MDLEQNKEQITMAVSNGIEVELKTKEPQIRLQNNLGSDMG